MDNSYFLYSNDDQKIDIERFHICTWEFNNNTSFVEFGVEINRSSAKDRSEIVLNLFIPWLTSRCTTIDFYSKLKGPENSRFIFNDSVMSTDSLDGGRNLNGVIHTFLDRNRLCILPVSAQVNGATNTVMLSLNLQFYNQLHSEERPNIYFRFSLNPDQKFIATRKNGITKSTILYDIRVNQKRNITQKLVQELINKKLCNVNKCFCFNIVPNSYDLVFFDSSLLRSVRTLEYDSFNRYLPDERIKKNELLVIYNRKDGLDSYTFFLIYSKEYIGMDQLAIGIAISLVSGILLFIDSYRVSLDKNMCYFELWPQMPLLFWIVVGLGVVTLGYIARRKIFK